MKVLFAGDVAQESSRFCVLLTPGENEVDDAKGEAMIACGLVRPIATGRKSKAFGAPDEEKPKE